MTGYLCSGTTQQERYAACFHFVFLPNCKDHIGRNPWESLSASVKHLTHCSLAFWCRICEVTPIFSNFFRLSTCWNLTVFANFKVGLEKWIMHTFWYHTLPIPFRHIHFCLVSFCSPPKKSAVAKIIVIACQWQRIST